MPSHKGHRRKNADITDPTDKIVAVSYSDIGQDLQTKTASLEEKKSEQFMGLDELFWQCYGISPKKKR